MKFSLVSYKGWAGLKNGGLLRTAENDGIEIFLSGDQTLPYEQNLTGRTIAIVALSSVEWEIVKHHLPLIIAALDLIDRALLTCKAMLALDAQIPDVSLDEICFGFDELFPSFALGTC